MPLVERRHVDLVIVLSVLVASNLATAFLLNSWPEAIAQVGAAVALVVFALQRGSSVDSLGLSAEPCVQDFGLVRWSLVSSLSVSW